MIGTTNPYPKGTDSRFPNLLATQVKFTEDTYFNSCMQKKWKDYKSN